MTKLVKKIAKMFWVPASTVMELIGFGLIAFGIGTFSIPISAIVCGVLLIVAGGLSA